MIQTECTHFCNTNSWKIPAHNTHNTWHYQHVKHSDHQLLIGAMAVVSVSTGHVSLWLDNVLFMFLHSHKTFYATHQTRHKKTRVKNGSFIHKVPENKQLNNWRVLLYLRTISCSYLCTWPWRDHPDSCCIHTWFNYEWHIHQYSCIIMIPTKH